MARKSTDHASDRPLDLGIYREKRGGGIILAEIAALAFSLLWLAGVAVYYSRTPENDVATALDPLITVLKILAICLPIAMVWVAAFAARALRVARTESARLQAAIDSMRQTFVAQTQVGGVGIIPSLEKKLDEIATAQKQTETAIETFTRTQELNSAKLAGAKPAMLVEKASADRGQASLALGINADNSAPPVSVRDFISAMNFPESADDKEGFGALRRSLNDPNSARLIQASQDVLTLLSQDGIYMDDMQPDTATPDVWRKFAKGARGPDVASLGGVRDRSSLALASGRMRKDQIFRDAVHHFLRQFDTTFAAFEANADDQSISALSDTRTARVFMLLGRVTGTFD